MYSGEYDTYLLDILTPWLIDMNDYPSTVPGYINYSRVEGPNEGNKIELAHTRLGYCPKKVLDKLNQSTKISRKVARA
jgi:hypothetical protein